MNPTFLCGALSVLFRFQRLIWAVVLLLAWTAHAAAAPKEYLVQGKTMGTTYHIKLVSETRIRITPLKAQIDALLEQLNQSMSTYVADSEISRFNRWAETGRPFSVTRDFLEVMQAADNIHDLSQGAWDGTVYPLVNLWGFGRSGPIKKVPSQQQVDEALLKVGFRFIEVTSQGYLLKKRPEVTVDLASIAKGYGVDRVAGLLDRLGYTDYLVEIGGEVYAAGSRQDGHAWKVGVNRPEKSASAVAVYKVLSIKDRAMATSGDYRNYVEIDGRYYSHIIDPRNGYPVSHGVVSATVVAPTCTLADGLATALMVLSPGQGVALLDRLESVEGLIVLRRADGSLEDYWSKGLLTE